MVFWGSRWYPRYAFVLQASPFGVLIFSLASALRCLMFKRRPCAGRHLLFFAAAKKSRQKKESGSHRQHFFLPEGPQPVPHFTRQCLCSRSLPTLRMNASPTSHARTRASGSERFLPPRWQTVCRLSHRTGQHSYQKHRPCFSVRSDTRIARKPTHSLPPGRRWDIWHGMPQRGCVKRVRRSFEALATNMSHVIAV